MAGLTRRQALAGMAVCALPVVVGACGGTVTLPRAQPPRSAARLTSRPRVPAEAGRQPGVHRLGLDPGRDGLVLVPAGYDPARPAPLAVMLHGAGGDAGGGLAPFRTLADDHGVVVLAPESRGRTWDVLLGGWGPDVEFVDRALDHVFARYTVDASRVAVGGFSDGASYALGLGLANGDLFGDVLAFSPGFVPRAPAEGDPRVFVSHGTGDQVLPIDVCSRRIVPRLRDAGYEVDYREFAGGHTVPDDIAAGAMEWFLAGR
jgi:phospholipase/carboxylesterase